MHHPNSQAFLKSDSRCETKKISKISKNLASVFSELPVETENDTSLNGGGGGSGFGSEAVKVELLTASEVPEGNGGGGGGGGGGGDLKELDSGIVRLMGLDSLQPLPPVIPGERHGSSSHEKLPLTPANCSVNSKRAIYLLSRGLEKEPHCHGSNVNYGKFPMFSMKKRQRIYIEKVEVFSFVFGRLIYILALTGPIWMQPILALYHNFI